MESRARAWDRLKGTRIYSLTRTASCARHCTCTCDGNLSKASNLLDRQGGSAPQPHSKMLSTGRMVSNRAGKSSPCVGSANSAA